jgi:hypothetical protein
MTDMAHPPLRRSIGLRGPAPRAAWAAAGVACLALAFLVAAGVRQDAIGDQTSALINQQLDAQVSLSVANLPLPDVLRDLEQKTSVPFFVSEETYSLLPYGRETPINVNGKGSLRQTLDRIGSALGLEYVLRDQNVELRPLAALQRTGRRASVQDLAGLDLLQRTRLSLTEDRPTIAAVLEAIDLKLAEEDRAAMQRDAPPPGFQIENRLDETLRQRPVFIPRNATMLDALEAITDQTNATWIPWGDSFIVLPKEQWVRRRLDAPITLSMPQVDVQDALYELQRASGVPFTIEPGAVQRVPEKERRIRLYVPDKSVRDALESLSAVTGLGYTVTDTGVYIYYGADGSARAMPPSGALERPAVLVPLGDGMSLLLYPDELPPELREHLEGRRREAVEALLRALGSPATEPAN